MYRSYGHFGLTFFICIAFASKLHASSTEDHLELPSQSHPSDVSTKLTLGPIFLGSFSCVALAVGIGFGWQADQEYNQWKDAKASGNGSLMDALAKDVHTHATVANVLIFSGIVGITTSVIWAIVWIKKRKKELDSSQFALSIPSNGWIITPIGTTGIKVEF